VLQNAGKYWTNQGLGNRGTLVRFYIETKTSLHIVQTNVGPKSSDQMRTGSNFSGGEASNLPLASIWRQYQESVELWLHSLMYPYVWMFNLTKIRLHV